MRKLLVILCLTLAIVSSCKKVNDSDKAPALKKLYGIFKEGTIDECQYNGQTVFVGGLNVYDAGSVIYDKSGNKIAECNYAYGDVNDICNKLRNCSVVYRCHNYISGNPFVDKYGLSH